MVNSDFQDNQSVRPAGYAALVKMLDIAAIPHWHESMVASSGGHRIETEGGIVRETFTARYWPGDALADHLEFALKYDGVNLAILARIFSAAGASQIASYVGSKPTGKYARRIWYLYELFTGEKLPLNDVKRCSYVPLLDADAYITADAAKPIPRQCIHDNLLGDGRFCPVVRRTETIQRYLDTDFKTRCQKLVAAYPPELIRRALSYLYTKETKSSFEIEHITPDANRTERFVALLQLAEKDDFGEKSRLLELQNRIVDPRFAAPDYRASQNYVGETVAMGRERIHFVCPRPADVASLMAGLIAAHRRMDGAGIHPVIHAATMAYGFVFVHPFEDGNGRIHRFLIHNILARRGYTPPGLMFPVSASMLKDPAAYDASLEAFSRPLAPLIEYALDAEGRMTVKNNTAVWYRFIDMTAQAEALFGFIARTIETELSEELAFLAGYGRAKAAMQAVVDMPDRQIDLFIRCCLQNHGHLSAAKRGSHFGSLTDDEISRMEGIIQSHRPSITRHS